MAKPFSKQTELLILAAVAVLVIVGVMMFANNKTTTTTKYTAPTVAPINNSSELDTVSKELDKQNLSQIDTELNSLNSDTSGI